MLGGLIPSGVGGVVAASTWAFFCAPSAGTATPPRLVVVFIPDFDVDPDEHALGQLVVELRAGPPFEVSLCESGHLVIEGRLQFFVGVAHRGPAGEQGL